MYPFKCFWAQLGEQLAQLVPTSGVDVVELEDEGTCVRFSPLLTAAGNMNTHRHTNTTFCLDLFLILLNIASKS